MVKEPNQKVIDILDGHINGRSVLAFSKEVGISRITINSWRLGGTPDLGVLLWHYFKGTEAGKDLAIDLICMLDQEVASRLVNCI